MDAADARIFDIPMPDGRNVRMDAYLPLAGRAAGIVILCHGFRGHRRWGFLPELSLRLRDAGLAAVSMDFSLNGFAHHPDTGPAQEGGRFDPEIFRKNTISRELSDLNAVVRYLSANGLGEDLPPHSPIGLYGHSRGAVSVILHALEEKGCRAICTWATTSDPNFFTDRQKQLWRQSGFFEFIDSQNGTALALDVTYLEDLEANRERFRLLEQVRHLTVPHLLVHGNMDMVVPPKCTEDLHRAETQLKDKHMVLLKTGHTFGYANMSSGTSQAFETAAGDTVRWFRKYLSAGS
jgi:dienelactone hydrolase